MNRRTFCQRSLLAAAANATPAGLARAAAPRKKIALLGTVVRVHSHAQHFIDRFLLGFRTALFLLAIQDFNYAGLRADNGEVIACQMYLPMPGSSATTADFFNPLVHHIERMVVENRAPYPVERTLLTSGMTLAAVESLHRGQVRLETPEMEVKYQTPEESLFWRE